MKTHEVVVKPALEKELKRVMDRVCEEVDEVEAYYVVLTAFLTARYDHAIRKVLFPDLPPIPLDNK